MLCVFLIRLFAGLTPHIRRDVVTTEVGHEPGALVGGQVFVDALRGAAELEHALGDVVARHESLRLADLTALVELDGAPLSTYTATHPAPGKKIDFDSSTAKAYRSQLAALRNDFKKWLRQNAPKAKVTGEYDISLNAVALRLGGEKLSTIQSAPMVVRAEYEGLY